jgi:hypothetical protein
MSRNGREVREGWAARMLAWQLADQQKAGRTCALPAGGVCQRIYRSNGLVLSRLGEGAQAFFEAFSGRERSSDFEQSSFPMGTELQPGGKAERPAVLPMNLMGLISVPALGAALASGSFSGWRDMRWGD